MKLLLYCTKSKWQLFKDIITGKWLIDKIKNRNAVNGKVVAECDYDVEEIIYRETTKNNYEFGTKTIIPNDFLKKTCLTLSELCQYIGKGEQWKKGKYGYAIHIKNLHIFDKPKELNEFYKFVGINKDINNFKSIEKAPQNMMYAYEYISEIGFSETWNRMLNDCIIISIHPKWLCKILNGEKKIEVRKKVLKEML